MKIQELAARKGEIVNNINTFVKDKNFDQNLGRTWYINAFNDLKEIMADLKIENHITIKEVALICSILSPANRWETNLSDTKNLLSWYFVDDFKESKKPTFYTYGSNVLKCVKFLEERHLHRFLYSHHNIENVYFEFSQFWAYSNMKAPKTRNFYLNLRNPFFLNSLGEYFTIDRHMLKIAGLDVLSLTGKQYDLLKTYYFDVFKSSKLDCKFHEFQAILWANYVFIKRGVLHY
jgi:hypothetical protein